MIGTLKKLLHGHRTEDSSTFVVCNATVAAHGSSEVMPQVESTISTPNKDFPFPQESPWLQPGQSLGAGKKLQRSKLFGGPLNQSPTFASMLQSPKKSPTHRWMMRHQLQMMNQLKNKAHLMNQRISSCTPHQEQEGKQQNVQKFLQKSLGLATSILSKTKERGTAHTLLLRKP